MRVLVVDDEPSVREALKRALQMEGYEVAVAADGRQALEVMYGPPSDRPDALVLDILMPDIDGLARVSVRPETPSRPSCSRRATRWPTEWPASMRAPTTTWSSRSPWRSC